MQFNFNDTTWARTAVQEVEQLLSHTNMDDLLYLGKDSDFHNIVDVLLNDQSKLTANLTHLTLSGVNNSSINTDDEANNQPQNGHILSSYRYRLNSIERILLSSHLIQLVSFEQCRQFQFRFNLTRLIDLIAVGELE